MFEYKENFLMGPKAEFGCGETPAHVCSATNTAKDQLNELARLVGGAETPFNAPESASIDSTDENSSIDFDLEGELTKTFDSTAMTPEISQSSAFDTTAIENAFAKPGEAAVSPEVDFSDMIGEALEKALQEEVAADPALGNAPAIAPVPPQPSIVSNGWDAPEIVSPPSLPSVTQSEIQVAPAPGFEPAQTNDFASTTMDFSDPAAEFQNYNPEPAPMPEMATQPAQADVGTLHADTVMVGAATLGAAATAETAAYQALDPAAVDAPISIPDPHELMAIDAPRRSGRKAAIAVVAVALLGGSAALAFNMFGANEGSAPTILASSDPVKVKPKETGGKVVPNQDQAVYRSVEGKAKTTATQERLKDNTEKPIAVAAKAPVKAKQGQKATDNTATGGLVLKPRKVRTVVVKPDGTIVSTAAPAVSGKIKIEAPTLALKPELGGAVVPAKLKPAPRTVATPKPVAKKVKVAKLQPKSKKVAVAKPKPAAKKTVARKPVVKKPANKAVAKTALPTKKSAYAVQIASQRSPEAAKRSYRTLSRKYAGVIGGKGVDIRKGVIKGKGTYYRVRIPANSKSTATKICSQLKARGGSCFVTR